MSFKKIVKIILIVIMCFVVAYGIKIAYGLWIWNNISSKDQLRIIESAYKRCIDEGREGCRSLLARGIEMSLPTKKQEAMDIVLNKNKTTQERTEALTSFYLFSRNISEMMNRKEAEFYFIVLTDKQNPKELTQMALKYLSGTKTNILSMINFQAGAVNSTSASKEIKLSAIKAMGESEKTTDKEFDVLIKSLQNPDSDISVKAQKTLGKIGTKKIIPKLLDLSFNKNKTILARDNAIRVIEDMALRGIKDLKTAKALMPLLQNTHYAIRLAGSDALKAITGKKYKIKDGTEKEKDEILDSIFFGE